MAFYNSINDRSNFVINFSFTGTPNEFGVFGHAYHDAADKLADIMLSKNGYADYEGYPITFLYRHSFELYLKGIIYKAGVLCAFRDIEFENTLKNTHKVTRLADLVNRILPKLFPDDNYTIPLCGRIVKIAREFSEIDPDSFSYRYPVTSNYAAPSTKPHQVLNMSSVRSSLSELLKDLSGVTDALDYEIDIAGDFHEFMMDAKREFELERASQW